MCCGVPGAVEHSTNLRHRTLPAEGVAHILGSLAQEKWHLDHFLVLVE